MTPNILSIYYIKFFFIGILVGTFVLCGCGSKNEKDVYKDWNDFATQKKYGGDYLRDFPFGSPDSVVRRLQTDLPPEWRSKAVEYVYYRLPATMPDYQILTYLDKFDAAFPNDSVRAFTQLMRGHISVEHVQYDSARLFLHDSYALSIKNNRLLRASDAQFNLAEILVKEGNYPEGIRILLECYSIREPLKLTDGGLEEVMLALGRSYRFYENYAAAKEWDKKVWKLSANDKLRRGTSARAAMCLASDYLNLQQLDSAKMMIDTSFALAANANIDAYTNIRFYTRAEISRALGKCAAAMTDYRSAINQRLHLEDAMFRSRFNRGLADNYLCLGKTDSAILFYTKALVTPDTVSQVKIYAQLANIYEKKQDFAQALDYERISKRLKNRMITVDKERRLERLRVIKETEAQVQKAEYARQRANFLLYGMFIICFVILVLAFFVVRYLREKQYLLQTKSELAEVREELQARALMKAEVTLTSQAEAISQAAQLLALKNNLIENLQQRIQQQTDQEIADANSSEVLEAGRARKEIDKLLKFNNLRLLTDAEWLTFKKQFDDQFPAFNAKLRALFPKLSASDTRLFLLLKIGFDNHQIAETLGISAPSVYTSRYRLRKKLDLENTEESLIIFITNF